MVELNVVFKNPQWNFYKADTIGARQKRPLYGDARFIASPTKNQKSSKANMKPTICHEFPRRKKYSRAETTLLVITNQR